MKRYIHELPDWPTFRYDASAILDLVATAGERRGMLIGRLEGLGFGDLSKAKVEALATEVTQSSAIEGEHLDFGSVRSSIAWRLGLDNGGVPSGNHQIEGVVEMAVDAAENWRAPLTADRLFGWHAALFPTGRGPYGRIRVAEWRDDALGPMQVVSGGGSKRETVHFQAPAAARVHADMEVFLQWFEEIGEDHNLVTAGLAHLWFVTIHPFEDGNGRIGRAILDLALARSDKRTWRCYSASSQIRAERSEYYNALEQAQSGSMDVTPWLQWYLGCLARALETASAKLDSALARGRFWRDQAAHPLNERQRKVLNLLAGSELKGKLTKKQWKRIAGGSDATATRDLDDLVELGILLRTGAGRGVSYELVASDRVDAER